MELSIEKKINLMKNLNWDYQTSLEDMLDVVEGRLQCAGVFDRNTLFTRCLERLPWHYVVALWGIDNMKQLYTEEVRNRIWPIDRRETFDVAFRILRGNTVPVSGWGSERSQRLRRTFLSDRWNRLEPGILQSQVF
jgi:hypothetical protein